MEKFHDADSFILNLSKGNLDTEAPSSNQLISPFKELQSNLRHLVWQTHQIAEGDYSQRIDFLGDFSKSYNYLIASLKEKQQLENQLKDTARELQELNATKDKFFSIIAHDLRNPFNALLNLTHYIIESVESGEKDEAISYARLMEDSARSTYNLLQNLLEWSSMQHGGVKFDPAMHILHPLVKEEISTMEQMAVQKKITVECLVPESLVIRADANMVSTMIRNLLSNALKYTYEGGNIRVSARKMGEEILISVTDSGIGMSEQEVNNLFQITTEKSKPGTKMEKGTGLGLMLCREFALKHEGRIWVESEPGKGSTFFVALPG
jgi:signal transduction histidine kinase